jgi:FkbM family methyltransferase
MKLLGSDIRRYTSNIRLAPKYLGYFLRCCLLFERPFVFIRCYVAQTSPPDRIVRMRDGTVMHLSQDPLDVVTLFVVFVREDYGVIPKGSVVVDIGSNIGAFAVWAARKGARAVLAFEPSAASFACCERNVRANALEHVIKLRRLAVSDVEGGTVRFPRRSSVFNAIIDGPASGEFDEVPSTTLATIVASVDRVDVLKLDCEGAEYRILFGSPPSVFDKVRDIRLEYHDGRSEEILTLLTAQGFETRYLMTWGEQMGNAWFGRPDAPAIE